MKSPVVRGATCAWSALWCDFLSLGGPWERTCCPLRRTCCSFRPLPLGSLSRRTRALFLFPSECSQQPTDTCPLALQIPPHHVYFLSEKPWGYKGLDAPDVA